MTNYISAKSEKLCFSNEKQTKLFCSVISSDVIQFFREKLCYSAEILSFSVEKLCISGEILSFTHCACH